MSELSIWVEMHQDEHEQHDCETLGCYGDSEDSGSPGGPSDANVASNELEEDGLDAMRRDVTRRIMEEWPGLAARAWKLYERFGRVAVCLWLYQDGLDSQVYYRTPRLGRATRESVQGAKDPPEGAGLLLNKLEAYDPEQQVVVVAEVTTSTGGAVRWIGILDNELLTPSQAYQLLRDTLGEFDEQSTDPGARIG